MSGPRLTEDGITALLEKSEDSRLEYKAVVPAGYVLARTLAAFANTEGGRLVIGIREQTDGNHPIGLESLELVQSRVTAALKTLRPVPNVAHYAVSLQGINQAGLLYVVDIEYSRMPVTFNNEVYVRQGTQIAKSPVSSVSSSHYADLDAKAEQEIIIGSRVGNYRVTREIHRGGMGIVFEAVHFETAGKIAIKIMQQNRFDADAIFRFKKEALILERLKRLDHPGIIKIIDFGRFPPDEPNMLYLIMDYLDGESLGQRIAHQKHIPLTELVKIFIESASALEYSHSQNVIHRDIKPENIMLVKRVVHSLVAEKTVIIDFGVAKAPINQWPLDTFKTKIGFLLGTEKYMAPEQMEDPSSVDDKADVFSLGVTMLDALALKSRPNNNDEAGLTSALRELARNMTQRDASHRPPMHDIRIRLESLAGADIRALRAPVSNLSSQGTDFISISSELFLDLLDSTTYAASTDFTTRHLYGVLLKADGNKLRMVAADGHRLSMCTRGPVWGLSIFEDSLIPGDKLPLLRKFIKGKRRSINFAVRNHNLVVQDGPLTIGIELGDAIFPNYRGIIRMESERKFTIEHDTLSRALQSLFPEKNGNDRIVLHLVRGFLEIRSDGPKSRVAVDSLAPIECDYDGKDFTIFFRAQYIKEFVTHAKPGKLSIEFNDELDSGQFRIETVSKDSHREYSGVIMPMRA